MNSQSYWFQVKPDTLQYPALTQSITTNVVVVGGGLAGVLTAYQLAKAGKQVVLIEQNHLATGDTGFTTAFLSRVLDTDLPKLVQRYGINRVKHLWDAYSEAQRWLFELVQTEGIDCDFKIHDSYHVAAPGGRQQLQQEWEIIQQLDRQAEWLNEGDGSIAIHQEGSFHIRRFIAGLLHTPMGKQIKIYEETIVQGITVQSKQVLVQTPHGTVTAQQVMVTTGLPTAFPEWHHLFETKLSYVLALHFPNAIKPLAGQYWDTATPYHYWRQVDAQTLIVGGEDRLGSQSQPAQVPYTTLQAWAKTQFTPDQFPGTPEVTHRWSGSLFETSDGLPYITPHPRYPKQVWIACGFAGNGMIGSAVAARLMTGGGDKEFTLKRTNQKLARITTSNPQTQGWWKWLARLVLLGLYFTALITPAQIFFAGRGGLALFAGADAQTMSSLLFPLVGLYAFTFVWAQLILGAGMGLWRRVFTWIEPFHRAQGAFVLLLALLHPTMIAYGYGLELYISRQYVAVESLPYLYLGYLQILLLFCTVGTALLMKWKPIKRFWLLIHVANYGVFVSAWIHGWFLGSDVRFSNLKYLWIMYAVTAMAAVGIRLYHRFKPVSSRTSTGGWVSVATTNQVISGQPFFARAGQIQVALFNIKGKYYAIDNICSHAGGPLCQGPLTGQTIQCPWHESKFDVTTGEALTGPARRPQRRFEVKVEGESIFIKN